MHTRLHGVAQTLNANMGFMGWVHGVRCMCCCGCALMHSSANEPWCCAHQGKATAVTFVQSMLLGAWHATFCNIHVAELVALVDDSPPLAVRLAVLVPDTAAAVQCPVCS